MGLSSALANAMSGLTANQAALAITSSNVANANTTGYVTKSINQIEEPTGGAGAAALVTGVSRDIDAFVQSQLRTETGGAGFANQTSNILTQLQSIYGTPGGTGTLETALNNFTSAIQALSDLYDRAVGADHCVERGADARTAAQYDVAGHSDAAHAMSSKTSATRWRRPIPT